MAALSDYTEQNLLNHILRGVALSAPGADNHFALFTAAPADAGGGTEVTGGSYARKNITRAVGAFDAASARATQNTGAITFATPSANWGTITHWGMFDAATGGNLLAHGALTTAKTVNNGDPAPSWAAGAFDFNFTGDISTYLANGILDWLFRAVAFPTISAVAVSLHTGAPGTTGATEVSGGAYARQAITLATGSWTAPGVGGATTNSGLITFPAPSGANWGSVTDHGLWDNTAAGNFLFALTAADKSVNDGDDAPTIAIGALSVTLS